jgi:hypothetical protein
MTAHRDSLLQTEDARLTVTGSILRQTGLSQAEGAEFAR